MTAMSAASGSPRFIDTHTVPLEPAPLDPADVVAGEPQTGAAAFATIASSEVGVWEHTAGTSRDVEVDEIFLVLSGSGTVSFGGGETVDLVPGRLVRLHAGELTTWTVTDTLRKVYVTG
jgi:uncharacterized cupin superfamily protein